MMHTLVDGNIKIIEKTISRLETIIKLFNPKDVQEMLLERSDEYPSALTPLASWMSKNPRYDGMEVLEILVKYSTGEELEMINGEGDLPLHVVCVPFRIRNSKLST